MRIAMSAWHVAFPGGQAMKFTRRDVLVLLLFACIGGWLILLALQHLYAEKENFDEIEPGLFMGGDVTAPPPGTTAVMNLCEKEDEYRCEIHVWEPIRDAAPAPSIAWLAKQVEFVEAQRAAGRTTYVHCFQGASRSGLVVTAYLMRKNRWTRDEALAFVRVHRPQARPNPAFMELLSQWELNK
jgi:Dual specificity phosphatase, catalytic domain